MAMFGRRKTVVEKRPDAAPVGFPNPPAANAQGMRSLVDHRDFLLSHVESLPPFGMALLDALQLTICEDIRADEQLPLFDNAQMDGYAVRASDVATASQAAPIDLSVVASVAAGQAASVGVDVGQAIKVMTGAPLPTGADAVLPYEFTDRGDHRVAVHEPVEAGEYVRRAGSDISRGQVLVRQGDVLGARTIGLLAGTGIDKVLVRPRPRVVVISTGAELVDPGRPLTHLGQIHDANSYLVAGAAKAAGAQVWRVGVVGDDPHEITDLISDQLIRADLVITTGGVSQGDHDIVKAVVPSMGMTDFAQVAMQPGKPQGFGLIGEDQVPIVMLPGNPVSSYVSFHAFVRPLIRKLMGVTPYEHQAVTCYASATMRSVKGKLQLARGVVRQDGGRAMVSLSGGHGSHLLGGLSHANALVLLPEEVEVVEAGQPVLCWLMSD